MPSASYIGRFAPSPSGPLHFGSLVCALASFLDARCCHGKWMVRIEDIDPPREDPKHISTILGQLEDHGLHWDGQIVYQSERLREYQCALDHLDLKQLTYSCQCNRKRVQNLGGIYDGRCRSLDLSPEGNAIRLKLPLCSCNDEVGIRDLLMGEYYQKLAWDVGDFLLKRRDGLYSYQLASVIDDQFQGITRIVRGSDLINSTPRQVYLQKCLGYPNLEYAHIPLAIDHQGKKLSKQNRALPIIGSHASGNIWSALDWLNQNPPRKLMGAPINELLGWATIHWNLQSVPKKVVCFRPYLADPI